MRKLRAYIGGSLAFLVISTANAQPLTDELVVTTTRSASQWLLNPGNISRLSADALRLEYPAQLLNRAAGVGIHQNNGQEHLTAIRSPVLTGGAGAGSFLFLEDGIAMRASGFANVNALLDALPAHSERVEIVRGPGSALYGGNAVHGMVNFVSRPVFARDTRLDYSFGSYDRQQVHASSANTHMQAGAQWGIRSSVSYQYDGGYRDNSNGRQTKARLQTGWRNQQSQWKFSLTGVEFKQNTAGYVEGDGAYREEALARSNPQVASGLRPYRDARSLRGALAWQHEFSSEHRLRITPYWRSNDMEFLMHFLPGTPTETNKHWSIGVQSAWDWRMPNGINVIIGLDGEFTRGALDEVQTAPDTRFGTPYKKGVHYDYRVDIPALAPFFHSTIPLGARAELIVGTRLEWVQHKYDNRLAGPQDFGRNRRPADRTDDYVNVAPKVGLNYQFNDQWLVFTNYARAAHAPQTSDAYRLRVTQTIGEVRSETLDSIETGLRHISADWRATLTGFYMKKRNFYFRDADDNNVPNGRTEHYGIEAEWEWRILKPLSLHGSASYARHTYDFDRAVTRNATESIRKGDDVDGAPRTLANLRLEWRPIPKLTTGWEYEHVGKYYMDASNAHRYRGHNLVHMSLRYQLLDAIELYANIRNLFNSRYATRADYWFGDERYFVGEPLSAYGGIRMTF